MSRTTTFAASSKCLLSPLFDCKHWPPIVGLNGSVHAGSTGVGLTHTVHHPLSPSTSSTATFEGPLKLWCLWPTFTQVRLAAALFEINDCVLSDIGSWERFTSYSKNKNRKRWFWRVVCHFRSQLEFFRPIKPLGNSANFADSAILAHSNKPKWNIVAPDSRTSFSRKQMEDLASRWIYNYRHILTQVIT